MKTLILSASLLIATSLSLSAKTIKYPEKNPAFNITLPDDWTAGDCRGAQGGDGRDLELDHTDLGRERGLAWALLSADESTARTTSI